MSGVCGIVLGVMFWAAIALLGLHLLLQQMAWLQQGIMVAGGCYLCWMGYQLIRSAVARSQHQQSSVNCPLPVRNNLFLWGLLTNLSNPKAVIYFGSIFSLFLGDEITVGERWGIFLLVTLETLLWFTLVALIFSMPVMRRGYQRLGKWIDGVAGVLFIAFGLHLFFAK